MIVLLEINIRIMNISSLQTNRNPDLIKCIVFDFYREDQKEVRHNSILQ
jgi:hypothetical protein